jgi:hypothetical protein
VLDNVKVLNAKAIAGSDDGARVVRLVKVFRDDSNVAGSQGQNFLDPLFSPVGYEAAQVALNPVLKIAIHEDGLSPGGPSALYL